MPSYPAFCASLADATKSSMVLSTARVDRADALNGVMGDFVALAETLNGV